MKKGFTLIELLATIIVLGIISLIATPIILDTISESKNKANLVEAELIYKEISDYCVKNEFDDIKKFECSNSLNANEVNKLLDKFNGKVLSIKYNQETEKITSLILQVNDKKIKMCLNKSFLNYDEKCEEDYYLKNIIIQKYPQLKLGSNGCESDPNNENNNDGNYSYMGGCYLRGEQFDNILRQDVEWKIMGINVDGTLRLIKQSSTGSNSILELNEKYSNWQNTKVYKMLSNEYINLLFSRNDLLVKGKFCFDKNQEVLTPSRKDCNQIEEFNTGIITLDEYTLSGLDKSYLNLKQDFWTMTLYDTEYGWSVKSDGTTYFFDNLLSKKYSIFPIINIKSDIKVSGDGTASKPFIIK